MLAQNISSWSCCSHIDCWTLIAAVWLFVTENKAWSKAKIYRPLKNP